MKATHTESTAAGSEHLNEFKLASDTDLVALRARLEAEMRRRKINFSVGDMGEQLAIEYFNGTPGLPNLLRAPRGTKNVDALSRDGDRYSVKTIWNAKKTGTVYPDAKDETKQLFEFMLIVKLGDGWALKAIFQIPWKDFIRLRAWDKRMNAWYLPCSGKVLNQEFSLLPKP